MAIDNPAAVLLCAAKKTGADFTRCATIGRQWFFPDAPTLFRVFAALGIEKDAKTFIGENEKEYAEKFLSALGAVKITSIDHSDYEGATVVHDMNLPIPDELRERFTIVFDGGTLEHVFNAPQGFRNCMEMVEIGGHFVQVNEANNFMGHGFWQFSPELIFRMFSPQNGFQIKAVLLREVTGKGRWYVVTDPNEIGRRVELCNSELTYILTIAQRISRAEIFATPLQQSDYQAKWQTSQAPAKESSRAIFRLIKRAVGWRFLPVAFKKWVINARAQISLVSPHKRGFRQSYYRRIDEKDLLAGKF